MEEIFVDVLQTPPSSPVPHSSSGHPTDMPLIQEVIQRPVVDARVEGIIPEAREKSTDREINPTRRNLPTFQLFNTEGMLGELAASSSGIHGPGTHPSPEINEGRGQVRHGAQHSNVPGEDPNDSEAEEWSFRGLSRHNNKSNPEHNQGRYTEAQPHINVTTQANQETNMTVIQNMFATMANTFKEVLDRQAKPEQNRPQNTPKTVPYLFYGHEEEDPVWFLTKMSEYFNQTNIHNDTDRILVILEQLRGGARTWFHERMEIAVTYNHFKDKFLGQFNSPEKCAAARAVLYGKQQERIGNTLQFLNHKRKLFKRLEPQTPTASTIRILIAQLAPEIRSRMRGTTYQDIEQFIETAHEIETDIGEEARRRPAPAPRQTTQTTINNNTSTPAQRQNNRDQNIRLPPTACRYCNEWHYHNQCPQNPYNLNGPRIGTRRQGDTTPIHNATTHDHNTHAAS